MSSSVFLTDVTDVAKLNRGPITSVFSQPSSCLATLTLNPENNRDLYFGHLGNSYVEASCYPTPTVPTQVLITSESWNVYYYSPGICPQGWSTATTFPSLMQGPKKRTQMIIGSGTSAALCCPSGYSYRGDSHLCASKITQGQVLDYVLPTNHGNSIERGSVTKTTVASESTINGGGVPILWQSSDLKVLAAASTAIPKSTDAVVTTPTSVEDGTTTSIPSASISTSYNTPNSSSTSTSQPGSGGLSTGAKAGIGFGVSIGIIVVAVVVIILIRSRRRREASIANGNELGPTIGAYDHKQGGTVFYANRHPQELDTQPGAYRGGYELPAEGSIAPLAELGHEEKGDGKLQFLQTLQHKAELTDTDAGKRGH